ncbi:MAG TPA: hypothetical protein VHC43_09890 [Mycobacteriales bacterium]|nr:hypothetical protein [Mycobacteriales bacterium]
MSTPRLLLSQQTSRNPLQRLNDPRRTAGSKIVKLLLEEQNHPPIHMPRHYRDPMPPEGAKPAFFLKLPDNFGNMTEDEIDAWADQAVDDMYAPGGQLADRVKNDTTD